MWNRHSVLVLMVLELLMTAFDINQHPTFLLESSDNITTLHGLIIHTTHTNIALFKVMQYLPKDADVA